MSNMNKSWFAKVEFHNIIPTRIKPENELPTEALVQEDEHGFLKIVVACNMTYCLNKASRVAGGVAGAGRDTTEYRPYVTLTSVEDGWTRSADYGINMPSVRSEKDTTQMLVRERRNG